MSAIVHCSEEVAQVVAYEIAAFERLSQRLIVSCRESGAFMPGEVTLVGTGHTDEDTWALSTEIESMLGHARNLREFFYYFWDFKEGKYRAKREKRYDDDVIAQDFVPDWTDHCPPIGPYLSGNKERLDKALAHLSTKRVEYKRKEKRWEVETLRGELRPVIACFHARLLPPLPDWFVLKPVED